MLVKPIVRPIVRAIAGRATDSLGSGFSPSTLFSGGAKGAVYDASDLSTLYLDAAGTTAATVNGLVGLQLDKSAGLAIGAEVVTNGGFDTDTAWTKGTGWAIGSGVATHTGVTAGYISQLGVTIGRMYKITLTITNSDGRGLQLIGAFWTSTLTVGSTAGTYTVYAIASSDTMWFYANTAGTTISIDNISVKELAGNHRYQSTTGSKPILRGSPVGANIVTNGDFDTNTTGWSVSADGTATVSSGVLTLTNGAAGFQRIMQGVATTIGNVYRVRVTGTSANSRWSISSAADYGQNVVSVQTVGEGYFTATSTTSYIVLHCYIATVSATATFNSVDFYNVSAGQVQAPYWLQYDGVDDFLLTAAVDFTATDKMFVCAGILRSVTTSLNMLVESSTGGGVGSFYIAAPYNATSEYAWGLTASSSGSYSANSLENANIQREVVSCQFDIGGALLADEIKPRLNGAIPTLTVLGAGPAGTGTFGNHAIYFGRRGGASFPYNGLESRTVICGKTLSASELASTERWVNQQTLAY